jgi:precorrin-3B C17-methyltransferase
VIKDSTVLVGYHRYLELIADLVEGKRVLATAMTREVERCEMALEAAQQGERVSLISSGDPGIYGMAGLVLELAQRRGSELSVTVVPGVTASSALAAKLGAPLMLDYAAISLSDLLVPWNVIRARLQAVARADLVTVLYNPRSRKRIHQFEEAIAIFSEVRPGTTPVGIGTALGTREEVIVHTVLDRVLAYEIGMRSTVVIGNCQSQMMGGRLITPRGYPL